jgi:hypothetical protein
MKTPRTKKSLPTAGLCAVLLLLPALLPGRDFANSPLGALKTVWLGETLKRFKSDHPLANCFRNPVPPINEDKPKHQDWLLRVDCKLDAGVTLAGYPLLSAVNPQYPFGMGATFHRQRLVSLDYVLAAPSVELLLPSIKSEYGEPSQILKASDGSLASANWIASDSKMVIEKIPIHAVVDGKGFMRVTDAVQRYAVSLSISKYNKRQAHPAIDLRLSPD